MAEIRLSKLTKQFSIGLQRLVDFLNEKGANVEMNPNAKISDEYLPALEAKFGEDLKLKMDSEKVAIKLKEIIELGSKKKAGHEEEEVPEAEEVVVSGTMTPDTAGVEAAEFKLRDGDHFTHYVAKGSADITWTLAATSFQAPPVHPGHSWFSRPQAYGPSASV